MAEPPPAPPPPRRSVEIVVALAERGWRRRGGGGSLTLGGRGLVIEQPDQLRVPLVLPLGAVAVAAVEHGAERPGGAVGRFPVLRRLGPSRVVPREEGIEGWLWTSTGGSSLPVLGDPDVAPNLAVLFAHPLTEAQIAGAFDPAYVRALAARSPLGAPSIPGFLARAARASDAENAFRRLGVLRDVTDREVPPTLRRSLPTDRPASPAVRLDESRRAATSVAPPGF